MHFFLLGLGFLFNPIEAVTIVFIAIKKTGTNIYFRHFIVIIATHQANARFFKNSNVSDCVKENITKD